MMQAVWYERKGAAHEVLQYGTQPTPQTNRGEVLVRVAVSGVNPSDTTARSGWGGTMEMPFPRIIPHQDGAGVIEAVGEGVAPDRVGERVWIYEAALNRPYGTAAQYTIVPQHNAVRLPISSDFTVGACLGVPAMTAHRCLFADGPIQGQTVLVAGGAGAVGLAAISLAKWGGASKVIATVSNDAQAQVARDGGADHILNRKTEDLEARIREITGETRGVHRVVEVDFGGNLALNLAVVAANGVIASYASGNDPNVLIPLPFYTVMRLGIVLRPILVYAMPLEAHEEATKAITACLEAGKLRPVIAHRYPLRDVAAAHDMQDSGQGIGKIVIDVD
jgi:NADPH2:quinone reductase